MARTVFAFDRDETVRKGIPPGPIHSKWLKRLHNHPDNVVYAIGNQTLKWEAGIPGRSDIEQMVGMPEEKLTRQEYLQLLSGEVHPDAETYIVVDDLNHEAMEKFGWDYYTPHQFYNAYAGTNSFGVFLPEMDYVPEQTYPKGGRK